jgi:hypothetical protein
MVGRPGATHGSSWFHSRRHLCGGVEASSRTDASDLGKVPAPMQGALNRLSNAAQEAAHESRSRLSNHPDPEAFFRSCTAHSRTSSPSAIRSLKRQRPIANTPHSKRFQWTFFTRFKAPPLCFAPGIRLEPLPPVSSIKASLNSIQLLPFLKSSRFRSVSPCASQCFQCGRTVNHAFCNYFIADLQIKSLYSVFCLSHENQRLAFSI